MHWYADLLAARSAVDSAVQIHTQGVQPNNNATAASQHYHCRITSKPHQATTTVGKPGLALDIHSAALGVNCGARDSLQAATAAAAGREGLATGVGTAGSSHLHRVAGHLTVVQPLALKQAGEDAGAAAHGQRRLWRHLRAFKSLGDNRVRLSHGIWHLVAAL